MKAGYCDWDCSCGPCPHIEVICSKMEPIMIEHRFPVKRYKKVSQQARERVIRCIECGWTIINIAKKFSLNYSTAKSIVQSHKKKCQHRMNHMDEESSSTIQCQSNGQCKLE